MAFDPFAEERGASAPFDPFATDTAPAKKQNKGLIADIGTDLKRGVQQLPGAITGLADIAVGGISGKPLISNLADRAGEATGFQPAKWAKSAEAEYSPSRQAGRAEVDAAWENGTASDIAGAYLKNPMNIVGSVAESLPSMIAGGLAGRAALGIGAKAVSAGAGGVGPALPGIIARTVGTGLAPAVGAGIGEGGIMAGQAMANSLDAGVDPRTAAGYAGATGLVGGALGALGGKVAQRFGVVDPETLIAGGIGRQGSNATGLAAAKEVGKRMAGGAISEGLFEELPQSVFEQGFQNLAQDKPLTEGMARAGVEGALAGSFMGGAFNAIPGGRYAESKINAQTKPQDKQQPIAGLLPSPTYTGTPGEQIVAADAERQAAIDAADKNAADLYAMRDAFEAARQNVTLVADPVPVQQRIDAMLGLDTERMDKKGRALYEKDLAAAFNEPIGITHDANQREVPFTMGEYLDAQVKADDAVRARERIPAQTANQQASSRLTQLADEEAQQHAAITQDLVRSAAQGGALSKAALTGIQTGATQMPVHPERAAIEQQMLADEAAQAELAPIERLMRTRSDEEVQRVADNPKANPKMRQVAIADLQRRMATKAQPTTTSPLQQTATQLNMPAQNGIKQLQAQLEQTEPFTEQSSALTNQLQSAVTQDAQSALNAGEMPVYKVTDHVSVAIHPSAQNPGMVQVTRYTKDGVIGDSQYNNVDDAVRQEGLTHKPRIASNEAVAVIEKSIQAESEYQQRKSAAPVPNADAGIGVGGKSGYQQRKAEANATQSNQQKFYVPPIVEAMIGTAYKSADELRGAISNVKYGDIVDGVESINFSLKGKQYSAKMTGRNKDFVLTGNDSETDRAYALRALLDGGVTQSAPQSTESQKAANREKLAKAKSKKLKASGNIINDLKVLGVDPNMISRITDNGISATESINDLGEVAERLRSSEFGYIFDDVNNDAAQGLVEFLRRVASGDASPLNATRMEEDIAEREEYQHKKGVNERATELGLKKIGGKRTLQIVEAEIAAKEQEIAELEAREERAAIQASVIAEEIYKEGSELTEADLMQWLGAQIEYSQDEINEADSRSSEIESRRAEANSGYDTEEQAQGRGTEGAGTGSPEVGTRPTEGFSLAGQTNAEAAEAERKRIAAEAEESRLAAQDAADKKAAEKKSLEDAIRERAANPDNFQFGEDAKAAAKPMGSLFDQPYPAPVERKVTTEDARGQRDVFAQAENPSRPYKTSDERDEAIYRLKAKARNAGFEYVDSIIRDAAQYGAPESEISAAIDVGTDEAIDAVAEKYAKKNNGLKQGFGPGNNDSKLHSKPLSERDKRISELLGAGFYELPEIQRKEILKKAKARSVDAFEGMAISDRREAVEWWLDKQPVKATTEAKAVEPKAEVSEAEKQRQAQIDKDYKHIPKDNRPPAFRYGEGKEPWEMDSATFAKQSNGNPHWNQEYVGQSDGAYLSDTKNTHRKIVEQAIADGKPVPANVLADYPDLKPKSVEPAAVDAKKEAETDDGIRYSKVSDAPAGEELVAIHNLTSENVLHAAAIGGIPVPSIGITKLSSPFTDFGEITLIADKGMIDPENSVPVFDRDAYTARFPEFNYKKVTAKKADAFYERMNVARELSDDGQSFISQLWDAVKNARVQSPKKVADLFRTYLAPRMLYAKEVLGKEIKAPMIPIKASVFFGHEKSWRDFVKNNAELKRTDEDAYNAAAAKAIKIAANEFIDRASADNEIRSQSRSAYMAEVDRYAKDSVNWNYLDRAIKSAQDFGKKRVDAVALSNRVAKIVPQDDPGYLKWVSNEISDLFVAPTITLRGKEVEASLDNIVDAMTVGKTNGAEKTMTFGVGKTSALLGKRFKSIKEIQDHRNQVVSSSRESDMKKDSEKLLEEYRLKAVEHFTHTDWKGHIDTFAGFDAAMEALAKAGKGALTDGNIASAMRSVGFKNVPSDVINLARQGIVSIREAATDYFEAKPQRAVKLNEFNGAVVPNGTDQEVIDALKASGITDIRTYKRGDAEGRKKSVALLAKKIHAQNKNTLFSNSAEGAAQPEPFPRSQAESRIKSILGDKLGKVMIDSGIVTFTNKGNEYQGATYKDGSIVLNLDALSADNFDGVLLHEGMHSTIRDIVGEATYAKLMKQLENMHAMGKGAQWVKDANAAIPSDTKAEHRTEELAAYAIERYVNGAKQPNIITRWVESLLSALRTAIIRRLPFGKLKSWAVNNLQPQDLANLAIAGLKAKARGQLQAQSREATAFSKINQTDTPAFKKWFGGSKVIDADGKPLVVYHGTNADFSVFKTTRMGEFGPAIYLTDNPREAGEYGEAVKGISFAPPSANIMPVYARIENPYTKGVDAFWKEFGRSDSDAAGVERAKAAGYDGIIAKRADRYYDNVAHEFVDLGNTLTHYIAFSNTQVKSAIGNNGDFGTNPDIRYSRAQNPTLSHALDLVSNFTGPSAKTFGSMKNVQTQLHKARKDPEHFGKVFNLAMDFRTGVSRSAYRAWEAAKDILPAYDNIADATKAVMHGNKASKELSRVSSWIFDGTTDGGGNPLAGVRWKSEQLRTQFNASEHEIGLYEQARNAIDSSLIEVANSVAWKIAKPNISEAMTDKVKALVTGNAAGAKRIIEASLQFSQNYGTEAEQESTRQAIEAVGKVYEQAQALIDAGYAPLSRFGRYTVDVFEVGADGKIIRDSKGTPSRLLFQKFEFESEAKAAERQLKKEYLGNPNVVIKRGVQAEKTLFSGVDPETVALFVDQVSEIPGLDIKREVLDEWRRNAVSQRSALMHHIKRKGIQGYSEDLPRVLASFLTSNARYASSNFHMADMQKAISDIPDTKGDVRDEAQELFDYINAQNEPGAWMRGLMFAWYLGGSPAAAAVNLSQPVLMTLPYLSQFGSATKHLLSSVRQAMQPKMIPSSLKNVMTRATEDGLVEAQEIHHLYDAGMKPIIARIPGGESLRARAQGAATLWGAMFGMAENFNRRITFLSAYKMGKEMGDAKLKEKGFADAYEFAKLAVEETQGIYAKENRPNWARGNGSLGAVGVAAFTFKQFSIQYVELLSRMAKSGPEGKKSALLMLGLLVLASGIQGGPGADDLDDLIDTVLQSMGYVGNVKKAKRDFLKNLAGERIADIVMYGLSVETPIDLQSRLGLGNLFPATGVFKPSENNKAGQLAEIFGPPGGMGKAVGEFVDATQSGQQANAFAALSPVFIRNIAKAMQMAETGEYRDSRGRKVESVDMADAIIKGIGFQPQDVATSSRRAQMVRQDIARVRDVESDIASIWAQGIAEGDKDQVSRARERLADWNASNPQMPIRINMQQIFRRVREMKTERSDRLERTAPRELRGYVRDALN